MRKFRRKFAPDWVRTTVPLKTKSLVWSLAAQGHSMTDINAELERKRIYLDKDTISQVIKEAIEEPAIPPAMVMTLAPLVQDWIISKRPGIKEAVLGIPAGQPDQERYRDHWGKLARLAGELALCLEFRSESTILVGRVVGSLRLPGKVIETRTYPETIRYPDEPGGCFFNGVRVLFSAEKSPLYEPLMEHLGAEFPEWGAELQQAREVATGWFSSNNEALWHLVADDESVRKLRKQLCLSSERGIFYGKCSICRDWE